MRRVTAAILSLLIVATLVPPVLGQQFVNKGVLVTQIMARTRFGVFERGDLVHVNVFQPAGNKGFTLSVHAEFQDAAGKWKQVPPPKTMLAALYTSGNYGGLRDYVDVNGVAKPTERNVTCFMPFDGFALEQGKDYIVSVRYPPVAAPRARPGRRQGDRPSGARTVPRARGTGRGREPDFDRRCQAVPVPREREPAESGSVRRHCSVLRHGRRQVGMPRLQRGRTQHGRETINARAVTNRVRPSRTAFFRPDR